MVISHTMSDMLPFVRTSTRDWANALEAATSLPCLKMRNSSELYRRQLNHVWDKKFECQPLEAEGLTVGIVGAGAIGCRTAELCHALGTALD